MSEHIGIDAIAGHPAINALLKWYPGYDDSEHQIEQYLTSLNLDLAIATAPVHGTAADRFLRTAKEAWSVGKMEHWTRHEADVNLDYARRLGWTGTWEPSEFFVPDAIDTEVEQLVASRFADRPIIGLHFGCIKSHNWIYKRWMLESFIELAERLMRSLDCYILLVGGPMERDEADQVFYSLDLDLRERVIDMVNRCSVKHTGSIIKHCAVFISNDSGPMHIAAAVGVPVVAVFGMSDPVKNGPWTDPENPHAHRLALSEDLWCRPCFGTGRHGMCERGDCLVEVTVDRVEALVQELFEANRGVRPHVYPGVSRGNDVSALLS